MALAFNDILNVTVDATALGQKVQFGLNYRVETNTAGLTLAEEMQGIADWFGDTLTGAGVSNKLRAFLPTGCILDRARVQRIYPTRSVYFAAIINQPGGGGAGPSTVNLCSTFALHTINAGKNQLAKYHPGPMPDSFWDNGALTVAGVNNLTTLALNAATPTSVPFGANTIQLVPTIFHRNTFTAPRWTDVVGYRVNTVVRTERRRTLGIGI